MIVVYTLFAYTLLRCLAFMGEHAWNDLKLRMDMVPISR